MDVIAIFPYRDRRIALKFPSEQAAQTWYHAEAWLCVDCDPDYCDLDIVPLERRTEVEYAAKPKGWKKVIAAYDYSTYAERERMRDLYSGLDTQ